jgi:hypothetical protein
LAAVSDTYLAMNKPEKALERVRREMKGNPERPDIMWQFADLRDHGENDRGG